MDKFKELAKRDYYTQQIMVIKFRMDNKLCPKCGSGKWLHRGSGFNKYTLCDDCGQIVTQAEWHTRMPWIGKMKALGKKEWNRRMRNPQIKKDFRGLSEERKFKKDGDL